MTTVDAIIRESEVEGQIVDVAVADGHLVAIAAGLDAVLEAPVVIDARRGALLPGLHDHHLHLLAMAGAARSVDLEQRAVTTASGFAEVVRAAARQIPAGDILRVVGYHDSMAGSLDRWVLDALSATVPVRVQHRSGAMWIVNSCTLRLLPAELPSSAEVDAMGRPTGRFIRDDGWLREHLPTTDVPDLAPVGRSLAARGITGVTDMTPFASTRDLDVLAAARRARALPQHVVATGGPSLARATFPPELGVGPVKLVVDEFDLPDFDDLVARVRAAHEAGRPVAVHCIGRVSLALIVAALEDAGTLPRDRLEHGSVVPPEFHRQLRTLGCTVVTQPGFLRSRGDQYLEDVDPDDLPHLWPCGSLLRAGISVGCSTDAPYGPSDPWTAISTAADRSTASGRVIGSDERVATFEALNRFLSPLDDPGGPPRRIAVGVRADLILLDRPLHHALARPTDVDLIGTWVDGIRRHGDIAS
ncbi:MAG: hypothetical protein RI958_1946 [Actinomycetota bacterium]